MTILIKYARYLVTHHAIADDVYIWDGESPRKRNIEATIRLQKQGILLDIQYNLRSVYVRFFVLSLYKRNSAKSFFLLSKTARQCDGLGIFSPVYFWNIPSKWRMDGSLAKTLHVVKNKVSSSDQLNISPEWTLIYLLY